MTQLALTALILSIAFYILSVAGLAGVTLEIGRIGLILFLLAATVITAGRLAFGRRTNDVL